MLNLNRITIDNLMFVLNSHISIQCLHISKCRTAEAVSYLENMASTLIKCLNVAKTVGRVTFKNLLTASQNQLPYLRSVKIHKRYCISTIGSCLDFLYNTQSSSCWRFTEMRRAHNGSGTERAAHGVL